MLILRFLTSVRNDKVWKHVILRILPKDLHKLIHVQINQICRFFAFALNDKTVVIPNGNA
ncbi:MAG TPA: hypothetical protein DF712_12130 [Balneola sp.]|mgnify:CR=1 FL=1|jgi:hypothetical protein|nr:hypothetical protein [Balneola sp.]HCT53196.1 hypothetical protein [Balneola sp.]